jgi:hypothetical protein
LNLIISAALDVWFVQALAENCIKEQQSRG